MNLDFEINSFKKGALNSITIDMLLFISYRNRNRQMIFRYRNPEGGCRSF